MFPEIALFICISTVLITLILTRFYLKLKELNYKHSSGGADGAELKQQLGSLMAENEEIREELDNIKYLLSQDRQYINLKDYEKEQVRIDKENKDSL
ncbi:hypothetical protein [Aureispira anguillae]|uniref:Uncharacterized protein n=1 Tax=Aureispira anguillae TaxID=2864201 RepID=A0A916DW86_9BACT|nr:hypothetical protein [Aureispira anguillae]BDS15201.1 hypothetical protein AsAng_0059850 [Aureispira anguillae]